MTLSENGPRPKPSEKGKVVPSSSSLPLMKVESLYMGLTIHLIARFCCGFHTDSRLIETPQTSSLLLA
jgi:hypothetical protein